MPQVIGIDHIYLAVADLDTSQSFYDRALMQALGFRRNAFVLDGDRHLQYFNRHFGIVLRPARSPARHDAYAVGLHHLCLRVDSADDVAAAAQALRALGIAASEAAPYPEYAADYVATFFTDPDGIRLEITNYRAERRARHDHWDSSGS